MRPFRPWLCPLFIGLVAAVSLNLALARTAILPASAQATIDAMATANAAVVGIRVKAAEGARSAETLGMQRSGSGVLIAQDGLILTIGYLMLEADQIEIVTQDNKLLPARAVAYDLATGFGLVRPLLPWSGLAGVRAVPLGSSQAMQPGEPVMAVTGPQPGEDGDVNMTQLVSKRAFSGNWEYHIDTALFTSPPVQSNGGNHSGAPLFNQKGELIGIGSLLVANASGQDRRLPGNMFVPVDLLRPILAELQQSGISLKSRRPWLGLISNDQGGRIQIMRVSNESPAQQAGLVAGDVVLAVDDAKVTTLESFYKKLWARAAPDAEIKLTVVRGSDTRTIVLRAQDRMLTLQRPSGI